MCALLARRNSARLHLPLTKQFLVLHFTARRRRKVGAKTTTPYKLVSALFAVASTSPSARTGFQGVDSADVTLHFARSTASFKRLARLTEGADDRSEISFDHLVRWGSAFPVAVCRMILDVRLPRRSRCLKSTLLLALCETQVVSVGIREHLGHIRAGIIRLCPIYRPEKQKNA